MIESKEKDNGKLGEVFLENEISEKIIMQMSVHRPKVILSDNFKKKLKNRLVSEITLLNKKKSIKKYKFLHFFWLTIVTGIFASYAMSFSFIEILDIRPEILHSPGDIKNSETTVNIKNNSLANLDKRYNVTKKNEGNIAIQENIENRDIQELHAIDRISLKTKGSTPVLKNTQNIELETLSNNMVPTVVNGTLAPEKSTGADSIGNPETMNIGTSSIAYIGEITPNPEKNYDPQEISGSSYSSRMLSGDIENTSGKSEQYMIDKAPIISKDGDGNIRQVSNGVGKGDFNKIINQAIEQANLLINERERSLYVLNTPHIKYISKKTDKGDDMLGIYEVYSFPLERIDKKETTIKEIDIIIQ